MKANNNQKLREALTALVNKSENFISRVECYGISSYYLEDYEEDKEEFQKQISLSETVLSLPKRNCDVGTEREQSQRFDKFCYAHKTYERGCEDCPLYLSVCCELAWAQMPYEGGAK